MKVRDGVISRDEKNFHRTSADDCCYRLHDLRGQYIETFCAYDFHRYTNLRLKPGEQARVRISIERVA